MRRPLSRSRGLVLTATAAVALTACGGSEEDPTAALQGAVEALGDEAFAFTISLDADPTADAQMAQVAGAVAITGVVSDGDQEFSVRALGTNAATLRIVDGTGFLRLDVPSLAAFTGGFTAEDLELLLGDVDPASRPVLQAVVEGRFIELPEDALDAAATGTDGGGFADGFIAGFVESAVAEGLDPDAAAEAAGDLAAELQDVDALLDNYMTITDLGEEEGTRELDLQLDVRALAQRLFDITQQAGAEVDALEQAQFEEGLADLPELAPVGIATITDGVLDELVIDLAGLVASLDASAAADVPFTLVIDIADVGAVDPVEAPADAVVVPQELLDQLGEQATGLAGTVAP